MGPAPEHEARPELADGWYQVEYGKPYRVNGQAVTDLSVLEYDQDDQAVVRIDGWKYTVARARHRTVQARAEQAHPFGRLVPELVRAPLDPAAELPSGCPPPGD